MYEVIYFYNVYGPRQIINIIYGYLIGIFEEAYRNNKSLPVVKPGTQTKDLPKSNSTVAICYHAWKKNHAEIVYLVKKVTLFIMLQKCLNTK